MLEQPSIERAILDDPMRSPPAASRRLMWTSTLSTVALGAWLVAACFSPDWVFRRVGADGGTSLGGATAGGGATTHGGAAGAPSLGGQGGALTPVPCPAYRSGPELDPCTATYVSSAAPAAERASAVVPWSGEAVFVAGQYPAALTGDETVLVSDGPGAVVRLALRPTRITHVTRLGENVRDLAASADALIATGDFGVVSLGNEGTSLEWHRTLPSEGARVDTSIDGTVVVLTVSGTVHVFDRAGEPLGNFALGDPEVNDVAIHAPSETVYVVGARPEGVACQGSMPFLRAYSFTGSSKWINYDLPSAPNYCASSRGLRVVLGADGLLYYAGVQRGGNSVHSRNPRDLSQPALLVSYDRYTSGTHPAILDYAFVARFDPITGFLDRGQILLPRDADDAGGTYLVTGIDADALGRVFLAGQTSCCIAGRSDLRLAGVAPGPYGAGDPSLSILSADFLERMTWTTWTGTNSGAVSFDGLGVRAGLVAAVATQQDTEGALLTHEALGTEPVGDSSIFLTVFAAP